MKFERGTVYNDFNEWGFTCCNEESLLGADSHYGCCSQCAKVFERPTGQNYAEEGQREVMNLPEGAIKKWRLSCCSKVLVLEENQTYFCCSDCGKRFKRPEL